MTTQPQQPWRYDWLCPYDDCLEMTGSVEWPEDKEVCVHCGRPAKIEYYEFTASDGSEDWGFAAEEPAPGE